MTKKEAFQDYMCSTVGIEPSEETAFDRGWESALACISEDNELRERIADMQHRIWVHWMRYFYTQCKPNPDGTFTIPVEKIEHWRRQMSTEYCNLTEKEKDSDREQADKILKVL